MLIGKRQLSITPTQTYLIVNTEPIIHIEPGLSPSEASRRNLGFDLAGDDVLDPTLEKLKSSLDFDLLTGTDVKTVHTRAVRELENWHATQREYQFVTAVVVIVKCGPHPRTTTPQRIVWLRIRSQRNYDDFKANVAP